MSAHRYASPMAFRRGLTDKLKEAAKASKWELPQLQRQMAYDRLLARLYAVDDKWIVKGATALLARDIGVRATIDIDVYLDATTDLAERELRDAAAIDLGDWFSFEVGSPRPTADAAGGRRLPVVASIGTTVWASFHVDLVGPGVKMTGEPEPVPALAKVSNVEQHGYRAYPLVDHVADKVAATFDRYGESESPSTRYKDLVDLVAIAKECSVEAAALSLAVHSEFERRSLELPRRFRVPDYEQWKRGYEFAVRDSILRTHQTLEEALDLMAAFIDLVLDGSAEGAWEPKSAAWA